MSRTSLRHVADQLVSGGLSDFITTRRDGGKSWQRIADDLAVETSNLIAVNWITVRRWDEAIQQEAAA